MQNTETVIIDHYRIKELYTRGGMAEIYLAEDLQNGQVVAVKMVRSSNSDYSERFRREVKVIATLRHKHILPALAHGEYNDWCYMVTPFIEHGTLNDRLARGTLTPEEAGELLTQIAEALQFAHDHGVVHRDIKPSNVLMRDDHYVYLTDFGLVKNAGADHSLTQSGYLIGTPEYMAPELIDRPATTASDTYALGVLVYQMLTGRAPFKGTTPVSIVWKHLQEPPEPPSKINPAIPYDVEQVILGALEKDPQKRFQTVGDFQQAYQRALHTYGDETQRVPMALPQPLPVEIQVIPASEVKLPGSRSFSGSRRFIMLGVLALVLVIILLFAFAISELHNQPSSLPAATPTTNNISSQEGSQVTNHTHQGGKLGKHHEKHHDK